MMPLVLGAFVLGALVAWWPGKIPGAVRQVAACLALTPVALGLTFVAVTLITRPSQFFWPAVIMLPALGTMFLAGAYSLWPGDRPRRNRIVAAALFVGSGVGLVTVALAVFIARGGTVVGTVTYKGQPVPSGRVSIMSEDGVVCTGVIRSDGRYTVYRVPPGPVKIAVATYPPPPPGPVPIPALPYVAIPPRYRDFNRSGLARVVTRGGQRQNLDLQP